MSIKRWEERLADMDHSRGTTDKMRKAAMLAEIRELRVAARKLEKARAKTKKWVNHAHRYQRALANERSKK